MLLLTRILRLARSRHGQRAVSQATRYARSPEGRARIDQGRVKVDQVRRQLASRRKGATRPR